MNQGQIAVIVGVGPGLGLSVGKLCAAAGMKVALSARTADRLDAMKGEVSGDVVNAYPCDATDPAAVAALFDAIDNDLGTPDLVVYNAGGFGRTSVLDTAPEDFERYWKIGCFGGFLVGQQAARRMVDKGAGTIIFTGATAAMRGGANFSNISSPKFALRSLSQSMARELGPQGIHIAHVIVDGQIESEERMHMVEERGPDSLLKPDEIADNYLYIHNQPRSAWTQEVDVRPWIEKF
jgi:NAD(P)-dependent dehydrogenase (short-subunit alcohol dehydrogenase family)